MQSVVDARGFLEGLYKSVGAGYIEIRPILDSSNPRRNTEEGMRLEARARRWFQWSKELDVCAQYCASISGREFHVFFGVALRKRSGGGTKADVGCATAVFADVDFKDVPKDAAHAALKAFRFAPSACIRSGNGVHVYWFLREPAFESLFRELERVNRAVLVSLHAQVGPQNIDRLLRVPGTANIKAKYPDPKPIVEVSWWHPELRYTLDEFSAAFPAPPPRGPEVKRVAHAIVPSRSLPSDGLPVTKLDALAQLVAGMWLTGCRHYLALHVGGLCAHAGLDESSALGLMELICDYASDEEFRDRLEAVASSYRKFAAGDQVAGSTALLQFVKDSFPPDLVGKAAVIIEILRGSVSGARGRAPVLVVSDSQENSET